MSQANIEGVISRLLNNQANEGDKELLETWISESESNRKSYLILKEQWDKVRMEVAHPNAEAIYRKIQHAITDRQQSTLPTAKWWLRIAASISFLLLVGFAAFYYSEEAFISTDQPARMITKSNPTGQKSRIYLADGSTVFLNAGSSIEYSSEFSLNERVIYLKGEAFFEVEKDEKKPFQVIASGIVTTALGTSFDVKAYPGSNTVLVSLLTGMVQVENQVNSRINKEDEWKSILSPGQQLVYDTRSRKTSKGEFDPREMIDWKEGVLYFNRTRVTDVINTLERWFGVKLQLKNSPGPDEALFFSGEFKNENLENILKAMSYSGKIRYSLEGKDIEIEFIKPKE